MLSQLWFRWDYVEAHDVELPDEYDVMTRGLEPFWALSSRALRRLARDVEGAPGTYTVASAHDAVQVVNSSMVGEHNYVPAMVAELLSPLREQLPSFRMTVGVGMPRVLRSAEWERRAHVAIKAGKRGWFDCYRDEGGPELVFVVLELEDLQGLIPQPTSPLDACPPEHEPTGTFGKTFVHDPLTARDPCVHPAILALAPFNTSLSPTSSTTIAGLARSPSSNSAPAIPPYAPFFAHTGTPAHADLVLPLPPNSSTSVTPLEWDDKHEKRALLLDPFAAPPPRGHSAGRVDVLVPAAGGRLKRERRPAPQLAAALFHPSSSSSAGALRTAKFAGTTSGADLAAAVHARSLAIHGASVSEWLEARLAPWVHYVPARAGLVGEDVADALLYFRSAAGEPHARRIAEAGYAHARSAWRKEDVTAYWFRSVSFRVSMEGWNGDADCVFLGVGIFWSMCGLWRSIARRTCTRIRRSSGCIRMMMRRNGERGWRRYRLGGWNPASLVAPQGRTSIFFPTPPRVEKWRDYGRSAIVQLSTGRCYNPIHPSLPSLSFLSQPIPSNHIHIHYRTSHLCPFLLFLAGSCHSSEHLSFP